MTENNWTLSGLAEAAKSIINDATNIKLLKDMLKVVEVGMACICFVNRSE